MASGVTRPAVLLVERGVERAAVHPDADGHPPVAALGGHGLDVLGLADVAGVEAQPLHTCFERGQGHAVLVVDVGDDRHRRSRHDAGQPSAASSSLQVQRTMSHPAAASA
jgi:hypothetical protein